MNASPNENASNGRLQRLTVIVGGFLLAAVSAGAAVGITDASLGESPFVWMDVAVVSLLCAMPFAVTVSLQVAGRFPRTLVAAASVFLLAAVPGLLNSEASQGLASWGRQSAWSLAVLRMLIGVGACLGGTLFVAALAVRREKSPLGPSAVVGGLLLLAASAFVPEAYVDARCRREKERMLQFAGSDRVADALQVAEDLATLRPGDTVEVGSRSRQVTLAKYADVLKERVDALERQLRGLPQGDDPAVRLQRGRLLAQLGRRDEAARGLLPMAKGKSPAHKLEAALLLGTIYEHNEDWETSLAWYQQALDVSNDPASRASTNQVATGLKGVAFTSRKLGRYAYAAARYEALIELAPTAENHFLLAQFYHDAQQGELARQHARKAIALAPHRFKKPGEELIDDVISNDFGCFGAFLRELRNR